MKEFYSKATLILTMFAISISLASLGFTIYNNEQSKIEDLNIFTSRFLSDYKAEIIQQNISNYPAVLPTWYECTLINEGEKPINIVGYQLQQISSPTVDYSNMNMGLFDRSGKQIEFPLNIKPQESNKLYLKVGLLINPKAFEILSGSISKNDTSVKELSFLLAKKGMDLYGNPAECIEYGDNYVINITSNRSEQVFLINFITNNHNSFTDSFSWYEIEKDI